MDDKTKENLKKISEKNSDGGNSFRHQILIATPALKDGFFDKSVVYLCAHSAEGAMGIVINRKMPDVDFGDLLEQLQLPASQLIVEPIVHFGGPVETGRGFVLHSPDFKRDDTVLISEQLCLTATIDILQAIAKGHGPNRSLFALGYAGWGPGQLESEIRENSWIVAPSSEDILFMTDISKIWDHALRGIGVEPLSLSSESGHA